MALSSGMKVGLGLASLVALAIALNVGQSWYDARQAQLAARANIARAEARAKAAADAFAANKATIIADALKLADTLPADALKNLLKYESHDDAGIKNAIAEVRIKIRDADIARARKLLAAGDPDEAHNLLYAHNTPGAPAEITALLAQARIAREKAAAETLRTELAQRKRNGVTIGMTQERVVQSSWGRPQSINRTVTGTMVREQWVYPGMRNYLYFENGILTTIQN